MCKKISRKRATIEFVRFVKRNNIDTKELCECLRDGKMTIEEMSDKYGVNVDEFKEFLTIFDIARGK